ncbi:hypothetical protein V6N11_075704 [Hibiscus sabdariffa]|uniref:Uncharacterized protein n=2 Tax=Hibiscus sabdariffa TaxID=183260 RepID=A0ABR2N6V0_9ROSI
MMERGKSSVSDEDEPSFTEECVDGHNDGTKGKKGSTWQRVKWTDKMARLLITAVSYIGEDGSGDCGGGRMRKKFLVLQKKGKWKSISKVMAERGYHVSPQQCEDKFNDLNKRRHQNVDLNDDDHDLETDDHDELKENHALHGNNMICGALGGSTKRSRQSQVCEDACFQNYLNSQDCNKSSFSYPPVMQVDTNQALPDCSRSAWLQKQWIESRSLQLEEQKLQIQAELLQLEKHHFKCQRFSKKRDHELEKMRIKNERMKLENERMALELKRNELYAD